METPRPPRRRRRALLRRALSGLLFAFAVLLAAELISRLGVAVGIGANDDAPDHYHLYIVGGSSARGVPYQPLNMAFIVGEMFAGRIAGRPIEVHTIAASNESTYSQAVALRAALRGRDESTPGAVLIYAGHNERIPPGPEGADNGGVLAAAERTLFRVSRLYSSGLFAARRALDRAPPYSLAQYEFFLGELVELSRDAGLTPIVSTVSGNIAGIEPGPSRVDRAEGDTLRALRERLDVLEAAGEWRASVEACEEALAGELAGSALADYWRGLALAGAGRYERANEVFWGIIDRDPSRSFRRMTRAQNALVAQVAREHGALLVDGLARLEQQAPHGLIGNELFADGHHGRLRAYLIVAEAFAEALSEATDTPIARHFEGAASFFEGTGWRREVEHLLRPAAWLVAVSAYHPWPHRRMTLAMGYARAALEVDPERFSAWVLLGLAQGAERGGLMRRDEVVGRLGEWGVYYSVELELSAEQVETLVGYLTEAGVDEEVVAGIRRTHGAAPQ